MAIPCDRQHLRLTVKRQMPMILGVDHMRDEPLGGQSTPDQSFRRGVLEDDAMTGAAGQFGPAGDDHSILRRNDVQPLALIAGQSQRGRLRSDGQQVAAGISVSTMRGKCSGS